MNKLRLDVSTLDVAQFAVNNDTKAATVPVMTGTTGYCNTCQVICNWTV